MWKARDVYRPIAIIVVLAVLASASYALWRSAVSSGEPVSEFATDPDGLLLETSTSPSVDAHSTALQISTPPEFIWCEVHKVELQPRLMSVFESTTDVQAEIRSTRFPHAPFRLIPARVFVYERPMGICSSSSTPPRHFDCPACISAQKEWFREHPAPPQEIVRIPGEAPDPFGRRPSEAVP